jgi:type I restriction-modification system DNA methylase subunit
VATETPTGKLRFTRPKHSVNQLAERNFPGFCKSATMDEIATHAYVTTPGRCVAAEKVEDDGIPFAEKLEGLTREVTTQFHESANPQAGIRNNRLLDLRTISDNDQLANSVSA